MKKTPWDLSMNLLNKLTLVFVATLLCSCAVAQDLNIRRGGGTGGTGTVDTNNFGVNGFINYGYTKDVINPIGVASYDITTNDTTITYTGPAGGELQLPEPSTCYGRWLNIINLSTFDLSLVCADRVIVAPDYAGSGTLQIIMPAGRSVTLLAVDTETWWETASQFSSSWTNGLGGGSGGASATNGVVYEQQFFPITTLASTTNVFISFATNVMQELVLNLPTGTAYNFWTTNRQVFTNGACTAVLKLSTTSTNSATFNVNTNWHALGAPVPTDIGTNKWAFMSVTLWGGSSETNVAFSYAPQN